MMKKLLYVFLSLFLLIDCSSCLTGCAFGIMAIDEANRRKIDDKQLASTAKMLAKRKLIGIWLADTVVVGGGKFVDVYQYRISLFSDSTFSALETIKHGFHMDRNKLYTGRWRKSGTIVDMKFQTIKMHQSAKIHTLNLHTASNMFTKKANSFIEGDTTFHWKSYNTDF